MELDSNPELQNLLITDIEVVSGIPAKNCPIRVVRAPAPTYNTLPIQISSINFGSILVLSSNPLKTASSINSHPVSLYGPFLARVHGVLTAAQITTSSGDFPVLPENPPAVLFWLTWFVMSSSLCIL